MKAAVTDHYLGRLLEVLPGKGSGAPKSVGALVTAVVTGLWLAYWFMAQSLLLQAGNPWQVLELLGKAMRTRQQS